MATAAEPTVSDLNSEAAAGLRDGLTVLGCSPKLYLAKIFDGDDRRDFDEARNYRVRSVPVSDIHSLAAELAKLTTNPHACVVRGRFVGDAKASELFKPEKPGLWRRVLPLFRDVPRRWCMFDIDGRPSGPIDWNDRESILGAVDEFIRSALPAEFEGVSYVFKGSGSSGRVAGRLSGHLWFWLATPYSSETLRAWVRSRGLPVDVAVFNPVQVHYTAAPIFRNGAVDPVGPGLRCILSESLSDEVHLEIPPEIVLEAAERAQAHTRDMPDPTLKPGLIGAFCRAVSLDDVLADHIPGVFLRDDERHPRRLTFAASASGAAGGAFITDDGLHVVNKHNGDPLGNRAANAWDLVRVYRFGDLDATVAPDTPINETPSHTAMAEFASGLPAVRAEAANAAARMFLDDEDAIVGSLGPDPDPDVPPPSPSAPPPAPKRKSDARPGDPVPAVVDPSWVANLQLDQKGNLCRTFANCIEIVRNTVGRVLMFNGLSHTLEAFRPLPWRSTCGGEAFGSEWRDSDDLNLRRFIYDRFSHLDFQTQTIRDALGSLEVDLYHHPVRAYLRSLPPWDGVDRLSGALPKYVGAEANAYTAEAFTKFLVAAVARVMAPGTKWDPLLVLKGEQGLGKSTFFKALFVRDDWFTDNPPEIVSGGRDSKEFLAGVWCVEFAELASMSNREVESVKAFVSSTSDRYRAAYGRRSANHPRQSVFVGTTNDDGFLRDHTGNRRFLVVDVTKPTDFAAVREDLPQLWAQALALFDSGAVSLYLEDAESVRIAENVADANLEGSELAGMIEAWVRTEIPADWYSREIGTQSVAFDPDGPMVKRERVSLLEIAVDCFGYKPTDVTKVVRGRLARAMRAVRGVSKTATVLCRQGKRYGVQKCYLVKLD